MCCSWINESISGGFVEWHADFDPSRACGEALHELAGDLILDDQPPPLDAILALILRI
jgi:hypothetical protein